MCYHDAAYLCWAPSRGCGVACHTGSADRDRWTLVADRLHKTHTRTLHRKFHDALEEAYGVVPKGLLTFLGSLYKAVANTTSGTLVCRFERQTAKIYLYIFHSKNTVSWT